MRRTSLVLMLVSRFGVAGAGEIIDVSNLTPAQLVEASREATRARDYDRAIWLLTTCVQRAPKELDCIALLGSNHARRAAANASVKDNDEARRWYLRYLELAPPGDRRAGQIRELVGAAEPEPTRPKEPLRVVMKHPRVIESPGVVRVSIADRAVVDVSVPGDGKLRFEGQRPGRTKVTAIDAGGGRTGWDVIVEPE